MIGGAVLTLLGFAGLVSSLHKPDLLWNSLLVVGGSLLIAVPLGGWVGWALAWTQIPGRRLWMALILAWAMTPLVIQLAAWDSLWGRLSWISVLTTVDYAPWFRGVSAVIWVQGLASVPWVALLILATRHTVSTSVEEAAQLEMPLWQVLPRVTWPQYRALWVLVSLFVGFRVFEQFEVTDVYQVRTWPEVWYLGFALGQFDGWGTANLGTVGSLWTFLFGGQLSESAWGTTTPSELALPHRFGNWWIAASLVALVGGWGVMLGSGLKTWLQVRRTWQWQPEIQLQVQRPWRWNVMLFLIVLLPQGVIWANLVIRAGLRVATQSGEVIRQWHWNHLSEVLWKAAGDYGQPLFWSWCIGLVAAFVVWSLAVPTAWFGHRHRLGSTIVLLMAIVSFAVPSPLVSLIWYQVLNLNSWEWLNDLANRSILGPVVALAFKQLGVGLVYWWIVFRQQPQAWREEMQLSNVGPIGQFWHLALRVPLSGHVFFLVILTIIGAGDLSTTFATLPPGLDTLPRRLMGDLHSGASAQVAAACLIQLTGVWCGSFLLTQTLSK